MSKLASCRAAYRALHESGCFVMPNPWDAGTAKYLQGLGFKALATTSAGLGFSLGLPDVVTALPRDAVLSHIAEIVAATDLPVNADFQSGYAATAEGVAESVRLCVQTGVAGLSIEDATGEADRPLYELREALDRLVAARAEIDASGTGVVLTARAECFLVGHSDPLNECVRRLRAYAAAGADVLFAPGIRTVDQIRVIVEAAEGKPVNVLIGWPGGPTVAELAELGVRRVSVGSALSRAAWGGFIRAAKTLASEGSFEGFEGAATFAELNEFFGNAVLK
jgi:2-methylisocitrate lyase-like PEP mutase family enzyme